MRLKNKISLTLYIIILFSWFSTCCSSTTSSSPTEVVLPYFKWLGSPVIEDQKSFAVSSWERISSCVGINSHVIQELKITVFVGDLSWPDSKWPLHCDSNGKQIAACGCSYPYSRIEIVNIPECFDGGLPTELMHQALWYHGESSGYDNPKFTTCRWW